MTQLEGRPPPAGDVTHPSLAGHRAITARLPVALASGMIGLGAAHIVALDLSSDRFAEWVPEPAAFLVHAWVEGTGLLSHTVQVETCPGSFPFIPDPA